MAKLYSPIDGVLPEPSLFGLLNSKTLVPASVSRWESGIAVESFSCNVESRITDICNTTNSVSSTEPGDAETKFLPYEIQAEYKCSTFGFKNNVYAEKARLALEICQNKAAEHEFWTGALAKMDDTLDSEGLPNPNKYLASPDATVVGPGGAVKPAYGLALLEQALADCGCGARGFIHATRGVASTLSALTVVDDMLSTKLGTYVIAGTGYDGSGPNGTEPAGSQTWMYATGPISAHLGDIAITPDNLSEATNTSNNEVSFVAGREAAVTWDGCCHYAVLVDLSLDYS